MNINQTGKTFVFFLTIKYNSSEIKSKLRTWIFDNSHMLYLVTLWLSAPVLALVFLVPTLSVFTPRPWCILVVLIAPLVGALHKTGFDTQSHFHQHLYLFPSLRHFLLFVLHVTRRT